MSTVVLRDYSASAHCRCSWLTSREAFPALTYEFKPGTLYALCGDIGSGAWGLGWALGGRANNFAGEILLSGISASSKMLASHACFIGENIFPGINSRIFPGTVKSCLKKALSLGTTGWTLERLSETFRLDSARFDQPLSCIYHSYLWFLSAAVGFASGKDVFIFPYLTAQTFGILERMNLLGIIDLLKDSKKLILVPTGRTAQVLPLCDDLLDMENLFQTLPDTTNK